MKVNKRELFLFIILLAVIALFAGYRYVFTPFRQKLDHLETELQGNRSKLSTVRTKQADEDRMIKETESMRQEIKNIEGKFTASRDIPGLMMELSGMIKESGLSSDSLTFTSLAQSPDQNYSYFNVNFGVAGTRENIEKFIKQLENYDRETQIDSLSLEPDKDSSFKANVSIRYYLLKDSSGNGKGFDHSFMNGEYGSFDKWYDVFKAAADK